MPGHDQVTFRPLSTEEDYLACIELQRKTWGRDFSDAVPMSILKITQKAGGIAAGAFASDGRILGFVYGLTGVRDGQVFHWSHMLAVDPEARDLGLGTRLKLYQRELLLPLGVRRVEWTYDPLEARNAHLNLNHLGAAPAEYVRDMYEGEFGSELAKGIGTDRFIVAWHIASDRVARRLSEGPPDPEEVRRRFRDAPRIGPGMGPGENGPLPDAPRVGVEIPANIQALKADDLDLALAYRASIRRAFEYYLGVGWRIEDFYREGERCYYGVSR
ncbi:MAG TPA: GNAT family N-acetyltransferase [Thermoanaerobaculia bacterium]|nr:GNAT family N-acetyltransferase [Thermoanaerobaculia bacterium]